jgi:hypothetical protein
VSKDTQAALNAIEVEVEVAHLSADGAEARRVGMCFGRLLFLRLPSKGVGVPNFNHLADMEERMLELRQEMGFLRC